MMNSSISVIKPVDDMADVPTDITLMELRELNCVLSVWVDVQRMLRIKKEKKRKTLYWDERVPPLVQAIFSGDPEEIRMLIHKTEDVNALVRDAMVEQVLFRGQQGLVDVFCTVDPCST
ncbi:hypothetical protein STEG23_038114 [Scotinomys teguina]